MNNYRYWCETCKKKFSLENLAFKYGLIDCSDNGCEGRECPYCNSKLSLMSKYENSVLEEAKLRISKKQFERDVTAKIEELNKENGENK